MVPQAGFTHVAGVYDSGNGQITVYVNGVPENTLTTSGMMNSMDKPFQIGGFSDPGFTGGFFTGVIDEVAVFNRALSSNEIAAVYLAGSTGMCKQVFISAWERLGRS